jgi:heme/copper-type cytochrome/quinol oxidase subunit 2
MDKGEPMRILYMLMMMLAVIVLALSLVALGWEIAYRYSARQATQECTPGESMVNIPLEIKQLCRRTE